MDLMQSPEQDAIQQTVRSFLEKELPMARIRHIGPLGGEALTPLWRQAGDLGFFGLGVPDADGGAGYSLTEEMILFEELGRALAPGPWLGSVLAVHALAARQEENLAAARRKILAGELRIALVERAEAPLERKGDRLSGARTNVSDANGAHALLILDNTEILFVSAEAGEVTVQTRPSLDLTRPVATVSFRNARCVTLGNDATALRRRAIVLASAEAVGGIQRTVEMSVEYCKVRHQFGKPIGSFQAVKHRCADMAVRAEVARSAMTYATVAVRDAAPDQDFHASIAKTLCAGAYIQNAADNVQNHGGMGFTWECDAHLYVKRARSFDQTLGSRQQHLDAIVRQLRAA